MAFNSDVSTPENAVSAAHGGAGVCFFVAAVTSAIAIASIVLAKPIIGLDGWSLADGLLFAGCGWGIWKMSRVWAVVALTVYLLESIYSLVARGGAAGIIMRIIFTIVLVNTVRATFAYARYMHDEKEAEAARLRALAAGQGGAV